MEIKQKDKTTLLLNSNRPKRRNMNEKGHPNEKILNCRWDSYNFDTMDDDEQQSIASKDDPDSDDIPLIELTQKLKEDDMKLVGARTRSKCEERQKDHLMLNSDSLQ